MTEEESEDSEADYLADLWTDVERPEPEDGNGNEQVEADSPDNSSPPETADQATQPDPSEPGSQEDSEQDDSPLSDLRQRIDDAELPPGADDVTEEDADLETPFDEMDEAVLDAEDVWAELEAGAESEPIVTGDQVEKTDSSGDVRHIPKRVCHNCRYFSEPPSVSCTHEGTEIREVVSPEKFEVVDCPMVVGENEWAESPKTAERDSVNQPRTDIDGDE